MKHDYFLYVQLKTIEARRTDHKDKFLAWYKQQVALLLTPYNSDHFIKFLLKSILWNTSKAVKCRCEEDNF